MEIRQIIGWNLRRIRVAKKISQERLALDANIDRAYAGRIERGEENVTVSTLEALAKVLGTPVSDLFAAPKKLTPIAPLRAGRKPKDSKH